MGHWIKAESGAAVQVRSPPLSVAAAAAAATVTAQLAVHLSAKLFSPLNACLVLVQPNGRVFSNDGSFDMHSFMFSDK